METISKNLHQVPEDCGHCKHFKILSKDEEGIWLGTCTYTRPGLTVATAEDELGCDDWSVK